MKNLDQFLTLNLDQFLTLKPPNLGPVFNFTAYIYIYMPESYLHYLAFGSSYLYHLFCLQQPQAKWEPGTVPPESCSLYHRRGAFLAPKGHLLTVSVAQFLALFSRYVFPDLEIIVHFWLLWLLIKKPGGHIGGAVCGFLKLGCLISGITLFLLFNLFGGLLYLFLLCLFLLFMFLQCFLVHVILLHFFCFILFHVSYYSSYKQAEEPKKQKKENKEGRNKGNKKRERER